jgi:hypothetical protein
MCFIFSLLPATVYTVIGYFVLYCAKRSEGGFSTFGKVLAVWIFIIAVFFPLLGAYVSMSGGCPIESLLQEMHSQG